MKILVKCSLLVLPAVLLLGGCGTSGEVQEDENAVAGGGAATEATPTPVAQPEPQAQQMAQPEPTPEPQRNPLDEGLLAQRVVYFDYDSSVIRDDSMPMLRAHADFLASNPQPITLEGHCDERGTREYNIALGERRADAVRRVLMANGVNGGQINIVSYGEERPAALGHNESAWSQNRRTEVVYQR